MLSEVQNLVNVTLSSENPSNLKNTARNDMIDENFGELWDTQVATGLTAD